MISKKTKNLIKSFYLLIVLILILQSFILFAEAQRNNLAVYFFDVGQGDSILIQTPFRQKILIDGGPDNSVIYKLGKYLPFYDRTIDLIISTHPDSDHLTGLLEVAKRYQIKNILITGVSSESALNQIWLAEIKAKKINILLAGQILFIPLAGGISFDILYPDHSLAGQKLKESNDGSIVVKLKDNLASFLFTGDAPAKTIEKYLLEKRVDLHSQVLKVGHHGSKYSSGVDFLRAVSPVLAVISVGKNNFGHPAPEILSRLASLEIPILNTLNRGDIIIKSDGKGLTLE